MFPFSMRVGTLVEIVLLSHTYAKLFKFQKKFLFLPQFAIILHLFAFLLKIFHFAVQQIFITYVILYDFGTFLGLITMRA